MRITDDSLQQENGCSKMPKKKKRAVAKSDADKNSVVENDSKIEAEIFENGIASEDVKDVVSLQNGTVAKKCLHSKGAFNASVIRKKLKTMNSFFCEQCEADNCIDENDVVWLCLCCGHRGCGRYSVKQHALKHFEIARSVQHSLVFNLNAPQVWCYQCDDELSPETQPQLKQAVTEILSRLSTINAKSEQSAETPAKRKLSPTENFSRSKSSKEKVENSQSSVKGLSNLGNTCFFNSVVQNLIQTHHLDEILDSDRLLVKGTSVILRPSVSGDNLVTADVQEDQKIPYAPLTVTLNDDLGPLTKSLCTIFKEFKSAKSTVLSPTDLFRQVCAKAPRFKGFQQQDSHELLRYLLDALREEEQRRLRLALLQAFKLQKSVKPETLPASEKNKLKVYDRAADVTCVEQVFGGQLVQCIKCLECGKSSLKLESFLDLSLPIAENKDSNANSVVSKLGDDFLSSLASKRSGKSKHMIKKEKKLARKQGKGIFGAGNRRKESVKQETENSQAEVSTNDDDSKNDLTLNDSANSIVENVEKLSLDETIPDIDDVKMETDNENSCVDSSNQNSSTPSPPPTSDNLHKIMEPLAASTGLLEGGCHLASCLAEFMSTETLSGKNKFGCEHCSKVQNGNESTAAEEDPANINAAKTKIKTVYTDALKQYLIFSPPAVLTIHLKRFHQIGGSFRKINKHVDFPLILDLAPYCSKYGSRISMSENRILYSLYGVVSHSGRLSGGHYVAYVKVREKLKQFSNVFLQSGPVASTKAVDLNKNIVVPQTNSPAKTESNEGVPASGGKWYYISDSQVTETVESKVLNAEAYLLFYERFL